MKLKVCGMREAENIKGLTDLKPDFIGFIFYPKSARYVDELDKELLNSIPSTIKKVGVFVNEEIEKVVALNRKYKLDYAQLHGDEDKSYAEELKANGIKVIKVFRVMDSIPQNVSSYNEVADYLLFDTLTKGYGGSGKQFDWMLLNDENITTPFLLSGGLRLTILKK